MVSSPSSLVAAAAATLPVGETGGSKGKGDGRGGGSPARRAAAGGSGSPEGAKIGETPAGGGPKPAHPSAREGRRPLETRPFGRHQRKPQGCRLVRRRRLRRLASWDGSP